MSTPPSDAPNDDQLRGAAMRVLQRLLQHPPLPLPDLQKAVESWACTLTVRGQDQAFDFAMAHALLERAQLLLERYDQLSAGQQSVVQAALRYLVEVDDGMPDVGLDGLRDDALVINATLKQLGLHTHQIPLTPRP